MSTAKQAARTAKRSTTFRRIARAGYVVLGLVHIVIGCVAVSIAMGAGGDADQDGAMEQIRQTPVGGLLLVIIGAGLAALAVWQIASAFLLAAPGETKKWALRLKTVGIAIAYLAVSTLAFVYALGGRADSEATSQTLSARIMEAPGGVFLLVAVGLAVLGVGVGFVIGGFAAGFVKLMDLPPGVPGVGIRLLGSLGFVAKGIAVGGTGALFVVAALTDDPQRAAGLDAALHDLLLLPWGRVALWGVAVGLVIYGLFCVARARYARM